MTFAHVPKILFNLLINEGNSRYYKSAQKKSQGATRL